MNVRQWRWINFFILATVSFQCQEDPIQKDVGEFEGTYRIESVEVTNFETGKSSLFSEEATIILRKRQTKDTITVNGMPEIVEPGLDENQAYFSKNLFALQFIKAFSNNNAMNLSDAGQYYQSYWFPDLQEQRITFWSSHDGGQYRTVLTVKDGDKNNQVWTYIKSREPGTSFTQTDLLYKEVVYVTRQ
ncbi:MAG: hypothetical protein RI909_1493 [Bacteroidota bacterium]|jgi:hypothetical protein